MDVAALCPSSMLLAGDWHGSSSTVTAALSEAVDRGADVVVQLGDFGVWSASAGSRFLDHVARVSKQRRVPVLFIDGNHEDFDVLASYPVTASGTRVLRPGVVHLPRGLRWTWSGVEFLALGGATSVDRRGRSLTRPWWPQEEIDDTDEVTVRADGRADVVFLHDCPAGVPVPGIVRDDPEPAWPADNLRAAWEHRDRLQRLLADVDPTHLFHGHYHRRHSWSGKLYDTPLLVEGLHMERSDGSTLFVTLERLARQRDRARGTSRSDV